MAKKSNKKKKSNGNKSKNSNSKQVTKKNVVETTKKPDTKKVVSYEENKKKEKVNKVAVKEVKKTEPVKTDTSMNSELKKLGIIIVILLVIFFVCFGITKVVTDGKDNYEYNFDDETPVEIQYDEILVGEILNQNRNEYYVLLERDEDVSVDLYHYYVSKI